MVFFRHNTGTVITVGNVLEETIDIAPYEFAKRPIPVAIPDNGQYFIPTFAWPSDGNTATLRVLSRAMETCIISYGLLLLEPM